MDLRASMNNTIGLEKVTQSLAEIFGTIVRMKKFDASVELMFNNGIEIHESIWCLRLVL